MENIQILSEDKLITLKTNKNLVKNEILNSSNNNWLPTFFKEENPFIKTKIYIEKLNLIINKSVEPHETDLENAKIIYEKLKFLNLSQACDERLWAGLAFDKLYDYMIYRWPITDTKVGDLNLKYRWTFHVPGRRALMYQGISKLWWFVKLTIDNRNTDNPYYLTNFLANRMKIYERAFYRNFSSSDIIRLSFFKAIYDFDKGEHKLSISMLDEFTKYISFLGGAYLLDSFSEDELYNKFLIKLNELFEKSKD